VVGRASIGNFGNGAVRVRHREFVADVKGTAAFTAIKLAVNPGVSTSFPWLSALASRFERYKFSSLCFEYVPSCAVTVAGTVMAAFDTDASDAAPTTKAQLMAYQNATRSPPWAAWKATFPRVSDFQDRFVRSSDPPIGTDVKMYDVANLFLATADAGTTTIGEIYVEYDVVLLVPQLPVAPSSNPSVPIGTAMLRTNNTTMDKPITAASLRFLQGWEITDLGDNTFTLHGVPIGQRMAITWTVAAASGNLAMTYDILANGVSIKDVSQAVFASSTQCLSGRSFVVPAIDSIVFKFVPTVTTPATNVATAYWLMTLVS